MAVVREFPREFSLWWQIPPSNITHNSNGRKVKNAARSDRLHEGEMIIRRFMLNQPNSRMGLEPGSFRNTFSGQEYDSLRVNVLLWRRGRVYFEDSEDTLPACKSDNGSKPSAVIRPLKSCLPTPVCPP